MFSSVGLPGTNGFVGEFLILVGTFRQDVYGLQPYAIIAGAGVSRSAIYMLWMYQRVMQGPVKGGVDEAHGGHGVPVVAPSGTVVESTPDTGATHSLHLTDITPREIVVLVPIAIVILWIGIYPKPFLDRTAASIDQVGTRVSSAAPARTTVASPR